MAALDFPASPTNGQLFTGQNGFVYQFDGVAWTIAPTPPTAGAWTPAGNLLVPTDSTKGVGVAPATPGTGYQWGSTGTSRSRLTQQGANDFQWRVNVNEAGTIDDATLAAWVARLNSALDNFTLFRAPAGVTATLAQLLALSGGTSMLLTFGNLAVNAVQFRADVAGNAQVPVGFYLRGVDNGTVVYSMEGIGVFGTIVHKYAVANTFTETSSGKSFALGTGFINKYNDIATVAGGVPAIYAQINATAQAASISNAALYTPPAAGMYRISIAITLTRAATTSSTVGSSVDIRYTTGDGALAVIQAIPMRVVGGSAETFIGSTANTVGTTLIGSVTVYSAAAAITYDVVYVSSGATTMQYAVRIRVEALG